ncbi:hypothetical protein QUB60_24745 [Microcoleus sp. A2-C5]|uniref:hypothetical protein n=1 Tax=unclassified Microcoleus TaxID=2642155 RepID=UPI002FD57155
MDEIDWLYPFGCLPPSNENEWLNLKDFVDIYNSIHTTHYILESFPENDNRTTPEPEILLRDGDARMVIERKAFSWTSDHIRHHQLWHEFTKTFTNQVISTFSDDLYVLEINNVDMPTNKREVIRLANEIASSVIEHEAWIKNSEGIATDESPLWSFFRIPEIDREDAPIESGICCSLKNPFKFYNQQEIKDLYPQIKSQVAKLIERAAPKFDKYRDCIKILILELHTNVLTFSIKSLSQIIQTIDVPESIDQIWIGGQVELNNGESVLDYHLAVNNSIFGDLW